MSRGKLSFFVCSIVFLVLATCQGTQATKELVTMTLIDTSSSSTFAFVLYETGEMNIVHFQRKSLTDMKNIEVLSQTSTQRSQVPKSEMKPLMERIRKLDDFDAKRLEAVDFHAQMDGWFAKIATAERELIVFCGDFRLTEVDLLIRQLIDNAADTTELNFIPNWSASRAGLK